MQTININPRYDGHMLKEKFQNLRLALVARWDAYLFVLAWLLLLLLSFKLFVGRWA